MKKWGAVIATLVLVFLLLGVWSASRADDFNELPETAPTNEQRQQCTSVANLAAAVQLFRRSDNGKSLDEYFSTLTPGNYKDEINAIVAAKVYQDYQSPMTPSAVYIDVEGKCLDTFREINKGKLNV